jgi:hypothetical protein
VVVVIDGGRRGRAGVHRCRNVNIQPSCRCGRYVVDRADLRSWLLWRAWLSRTPV